MNRWWLLFCVAMSAFVLSVLLCNDVLHKSMVYYYPIQVQIPADKKARTVSYCCFFDRSEADIVFNNPADYSSYFEPAPSMRFEAAVQGFSTTKWCGLNEVRGRESFIVVQVILESGESLVGIEELPTQVAPVVVRLENTP